MMRHEFTAQSQAFTCPACGNDVGERHFNLYDLRGHHDAAAPLRRLCSVVCLRDYAEVLVLAEHEARDEQGGAA